MCSHDRIGGRKRSRWASVPNFISTGPTIWTPWSWKRAMPQRSCSSKKISSFEGASPMPPNATGQAGAIQPLADMRRYHSWFSDQRRRRGAKRWATG